MFGAIASLPTAGFTPKVICVYQTIAVVVMDLKMTSRLPSGLFSVHPDANRDLAVPRRGVLNKLKQVEQNC